MSIAFQIITLFALLGSPGAARPDTVPRAPNEGGRIPVLVYHHIGSEDGRWTRTPAGLRRDLELLHARGYRPIRITDMVAGRIDLPRGLSPVVITFDDASPSQFRYLGDGSIDPNSAVGVLEAFGKRHPEWRGGATFCLLSAADSGNAFFGDRRSGVAPEDRRRKVRFLAEQGYELCNHSWWHGRLDRRSPEAVREQIGRGQMAIDSMAPGHAGRVFALPLGLWPADRQLAIRGAWVSPAGDTVRWSHEAVLLAGSELARSPHDPEFDPHAIQRLQVIGDNLAELLDRVDRAGRYVSAGGASAGRDREPPSSGAGQNPSPMVETTRAHERVPDQEPPGRRLAVDAGLRAPVRLFVPRGTDLRGGPGLLIHFHGPSFLPERAAAESGAGYVVATINAGHGSGAYDAAFADPAVFDSLLTAARRALSDAAGAPVALGAITLSGFSAGHGAVRAILRHPSHFEAVDAVLLLDGLHTSYIPPRTVLAEGGRLEVTNLESVLRFARAAAAGDKRLLITHSEIFPGTFASTTETTDHLLSWLGLRRQPVLRWGPVGMQQLSEVRCEGLEVRGYAGNTAPDHIDHVHGIAGFLRLLEGRGGGEGADAAGCRSASSYRSER